MFIALLWIQTEFMLNYEFYCWVFVLFSHYKAGFFFLFFFFRFLKSFSTPRISLGFIRTQSCVSSIHFALKQDFRLNTDFPKELQSSKLVSVSDRWDHCVENMIPINMSLDSRHHLTSLKCWSKLGLKPSPSSTSTSYFQKPKTWICFHEHNLSKIVFKMLQFEWLKERHLKPEPEQFLDNFLMCFPTYVERMERELITK